MKPITIKELIQHLETFDQDLPVAFQVFSEQCLLDINQIKVHELCEPRPDGWVQDKRPDKNSIKYLVFPGN